MASNKENRSDRPKTEGEKHQGVGVNTPEKASGNVPGAKRDDKTKTGGNSPNN